MSSIFPSKALGSFSPHPLVSLPLGVPSLSTDVDQSSWACILFFSSCLDFSLLTALGPGSKKQNSCGEKHKLSR